MIFINFKTYSQGTGRNATKLAGIIKQISEETEIKLIPVAQAVDIKSIVQETKLEVWAQHSDPVEFGPHTGKILPQGLNEAGALGTFLNHSENKFDSFHDLKKANALCQKNGLKTLIFASDLNEAKSIISLRPDYFAYEPPELIGSKDLSVATQNPDIITKAAILSQKTKTPLIVGAGIHNKLDIQVSLKLGADGFAVSSDILKATNPKKELLELLEGYK